MSRKVREIGNPALATAVLAEQVCLLYGWTAISDDHSERGDALSQMWIEWYEAYRAAGGRSEPRRHPELSKARITELAERRRRTTAATRAALDKLLVRS